MDGRRLPSHWLHADSRLERAIIDCCALAFWFHHSTDAQTYLSNSLASTVLLRPRRMVSLLLQYDCCSWSKLDSAWPNRWSPEVELVPGSLPYWRSWWWSCWDLDDPCAKRDGADALLHIDAKQNELRVQPRLLPNRSALHVHGPVSRQLHAPCSQEAWILRLGPIQRSQKHKDWLKNSNLNPI